MDTLIGDITPPDELMKPLTDRKIAEQEKVTYETQRLAEQTRKELQQAKALADMQAKVVDAERRVQIADYDAQSTVKQSEGSARSKIINAEGDAKAKTTNAEADAKVLQMVGAAEASKTKMVGTAEADVIKLKIDSMQSANYAGIEIAKALASSGTKLVPDIVATGGGGGNGLAGNGSLVEVLLASIIRDQLQKKQGDAPPAATTEE